MTSSAFPIRMANRMELLPEYMMARINKLRHDKQQAGIDLIDMAMGNPKDPTPQFVVDKHNEAAQDRRNHRYSVANGIFNLRNEISKHYLAQYDVPLDPEDEVVCTIGSKEGFSHLCLALLGPGDRAVVPAPAYPIHTYSVVLAGAEPIRLKITNDQEYLTELVKVCETGSPVPKVLFLNYPHNPTGRCVELAFFEEIVQIAKRFEMIVVHDFAYSRLGFDGFQVPSFLQARGAKEVGVEFGTMSKAYNMAGWRLGYGLGNKEVISGLKRIKGYYDYGNFQAVQIAAIVALRHGEEHVAEQVKIYQRRRDLVCSQLHQAGWEFESPRGGMFIWVKIPEPYAQMGSYEFAMELMDKANLVASPGIGFGEEGEGYLRMALVENEQRLRQAMRNLRSLFSVSTPLEKAL